MKDVTGLTYFIMVAISKDTKMLLTPPSSTKKPVVESNVGKVTPRRLFARVRVVGSLGLNRGRLHLQYFL